MWTRVVVLLLPALIAASVKTQPAAVTRSPPIPDSTGWQTLGEDVTHWPVHKPRPTETPRAPTNSPQIVPPIRRHSITDETSSNRGIKSNNREVNRYSGQFTPDITDRPAPRIFGITPSKNLRPDFYSKDEYTTSKPSLPEFVPEPIPERSRTTIRPKYSGHTPETIVFMPEPIPNQPQFSRPITAKPFTRTTLQPRLSVDQNKVTNFPPSSTAASPCKSVPIPDKNSSHSTPTNNGNSNNYSPSGSNSGTNHGVNGPNLNEELGGTNLVPDNGDNYKTTSTTQGPKLVLPWILNITEPNNGDVTSRVHVVFPDNSAGQDTKEQITASGSASRPDYQTSGRKSTRGDIKGAKN